LCVLVKPPEVTLKAMDPKSKSDPFRCPELF